MARAIVGRNRTADEGVGTTGAMETTSVSKPSFCRPEARSARRRGLPPRWRSVMRKVAFIDAEF